LCSLFCSTSFANMSSMYDTSLIKLIDEVNFEQMRIRISGEDVKLNISNDKTQVSGEYYFKVRDPKLSFTSYTLYMPQYVLENQAGHKSPVVSVAGAPLTVNIMLNPPKHYAHIKQIPGMKVIWWSFVVTRDMILKNNPITVEVEYEQDNFIEGDRRGSIYVPMIPEDADKSNYPDGYSITVIENGVDLDHLKPGNIMEPIDGSLKIVPEHMKPIITYSGL